MNLCWRSLHRIYAFKTRNKKTVLILGYERRTICSKNLNSDKGKRTLNSFYKTKRLLWAALAVSLTGAVSELQAISADAQADQISTPAQPKTLADFSVSAGKLQLQSSLPLTTTTQGTPMIKQAPGLATEAAYFDGKSAVLAPFGVNLQQQFHEQLTMEAFFRVDELSQSEMDLFSNQQGGGVGLGFEGGRLTFFGFTDDHYVTPKATVKAHQWIHAVGVIDEQSVALYVNGQLVEKLPKAGPLKFTTSPNAQNLVLGGDSSSANGAEYLFRGFIKRARLYPTALTADQIAELAKQAHSQDVAEPIQTQNLQTSLVGAKTSVQASNYDLNVQVRGETEGDIDQLTLEVSYDPRLVAFKGVRNNSFTNNTTVSDDHNGTLQLQFTGALSTADLINYAKTTIAQLSFATLPATNDQKADFKISQVTSQVAGQVVKPNVTLADQTVTILADDPFDYNHDGLVSVGDVALAPAQQKALVAQKATIYPYKHVLVLTTDGGGNPWDPTGLFYANGTAAPQWTNDPALLAKRQNSFALNFFNHEAAMSTSAKAIYPTMSGINYASILHGLDWNELPKDYQLNNDSAGQFYFNDFGKPTGLYPSIFKVLNHYQPKRTLSVFSEWSQIPNGIVEPDAAVQKEYDGTPGQSYRKIAAYITSPQFDKTAFTFLQDDSMDHAGHSTGFYNDRYWSNYKAYDERFKSVIDSLKNSGHLDDTLVIFNADHGGSGLNHGGPSSAESNIFIALYGQTVPQGKRLTGGSNRDITPVALQALGVPQAPSMTGSVFDPQAFMKQSQLAAKKRDTERVVIGKSQHVLHFNWQKKQAVKAVDLVIELNGQAKGTLKPNGGKILRDQVENGQWKITLAYDQMPTDFLTLTTTDSAAKMNVSQMMLADSAGKEIYNDLTDYSTEKLDAALQQAAQIQAKPGQTFTAASQKVLAEAVSQAQVLLQSATLTTESADQAAEKITAAITGLQLEPTKPTAIKKDQLKQAIAAAEKIKPHAGQHFTTKSYGEFTAALTAAKQVLTADKVVQAQVDQACERLLAAKKALVEEADVTASGSSTTSDSRQPSESSTTTSSTKSSESHSSETPTTTTTSQQTAIITGSTSGSTDTAVKEVPAGSVAPAEQVAKGGASQTNPSTSSDLWSNVLAGAKRFPQTNDRIAKVSVLFGGLLVIVDIGITWWRHVIKKPADPLN